MQVIIKHAAHRGTLFGVAVDGTHLFRGVGAQQIMKAVAAGSVLRKQVLITQSRQRQVRLFSRDASEAGGRACARWPFPARMSCRSTRPYASLSSSPG